jgi:hypothetical protein
MANPNLPEWAQGAVVTPNLTASHTVTPRADTARIAAARARAIAHSRETNAPGAPYSFEYPESYYRDLAGLGTSPWDIDVLSCLANILEISVFKSTEDGARVISLPDLRDRLAARIVEFGLSAPLIWEWFSDERDPIGHEWFRQPLANRIKRFKQ